MNCIKNDQGEFKFCANLVCIRLSTLVERLNFLFFQKGWSVYTLLKEITKESSFFGSLTSVRPQLHRPRDQFMTPWKPLVGRGKCIFPFLLESGCWRQLPGEITLQHNPLWDWFNYKQTAGGQSESFAFSHVLTSVIRHDYFKGKQTCFQFVSHLFFCKKDFNKLQGTATVY